MDVKQAVQQASKYLPEIFETAAGRELRLEGVEKSEDERFWSVTFSYPTRTKQEESEYFRDFKTIRLRDVDGEFVGARNGMVLSGV